MRNLFHSPQQLPTADYDVTTETEEPGQFYEGPAIPVHIASSEATPTKPVAPEYATAFSIVLPVLGNVPLLLLPRRIRRVKANLIFRNASGSAGNIYLSSNQDVLGVTPAAPPIPNAHWLIIGTASTNTNFPDWLSQQPLYAIADQSPVYANVVDASYGETG